MTTSMLLYVGDKNLSSWSLRPWLVLKHVNLPFEERVIRLNQADTKARLKEASPSARVPVLVHDSLVVWDSIAICEYIAELFPDQGLWPAERIARATARSVSAEMHSGFQALRSEFSMNVVARSPKAPSAAAAADIERVLTIWSDCRRQFGASGPFLFGKFSIADAMYAPVVTRFETYGIELPPIARAYSDSILAMPAMKEWIRAAFVEQGVAS